MQALGKTATIKQAPDPFLQQQARHDLPKKTPFVRDTAKMGALKTFSRSKTLVANTSLFQYFIFPTEQKDHNDSAIEQKPIRQRLCPSPSSEREQSSKPEWALT